MAYKNLADQKESCRKYYEAHVESMREKNKRYYQANRERLKEARKAKKQWGTYPVLQVRAGCAVWYAVKTGKLVKPSICSKCGGTKHIHAHHHNGYSPEHKLDVVWLCVDCHKFGHRKYT
jgi:hypothetical protein